MAGEFSPTNSIISSEAATAGFVPDLWSDEIFAAHKKNLVLANLVRKVSVKGKKGDSLMLPKPARGSAAAKTSEAQVTLIQESGTGVTVALTAHWEYSRLIGQDIAEVHALASMRKFYTDDAGSALAVAKDSAIFTAARTLRGGDGTADWNKAVIPSDGNTDFTDAASNADSFTDAGMRKIIQTLDDNDMPMEGRFLIVPPVARKTMMGLARFTEQAFVGHGDVMKNGKFGDIYGVGVYVTSNCPSPDTATTVKIGLLAHRDAIVLAEVLAPRVQTQYKQEYLATLLTADVIFGTKDVYDGGGVAIAFAA